MLGKIKWWLRELVAIAVWIAFTTQILIFDLERYISTRAQSIQFILQYRFLIALGLLATLLLLWGWRPVLSTVGYVLIYPLMLIAWRLPKTLLKNWLILLIYLPAIVYVAKKFRRNFFLSSWALIAAITICVAPVKYLIIQCAIAYLCIYIVFHYGAKLRSSYASSTIFSKLNSALESTWKQAQESIYSDKNFGNAGTEESKKKPGSKVLVNYTYATILHSISSRLKEFSESKKLDIYLLSSLVWTYLFTVGSFSVIFLGLDKIDTSNFSGPSNRNVMTFIAFSFSTITTSTISDIRPLTYIAAFFCNAEVVGSLLIFVMLAFILFTSSRERYSNDLSDLVKTIGAAEQHASEQLSVNEDAAISAIETELIRQNRNFMKYLLPIRYGQVAAAKILERIPSQPIDDDMGGTEVIKAP